MLAAKASRFAKRAGCWLYLGVLFHSSRARLPSAEHRATARATSVERGEAQPTGQVRLRQLLEAALKARGASHDQLVRAPLDGLGAAWSVKPRDRGLDFAEFLNEDSCRLAELVFPVLDAPPGRWRR